MTGDSVRLSWKNMDLRRFTSFLLLVLCLCFVSAACNKRTESAKNEPPPDFTGFWKQTCTDAFGLQIKKQTGNLFSVSFCGPGGCSEPGTWTPNTPIVGDPKYRLITRYILEIQNGDGWQRYAKCTSETNPVLSYSTMPSVPNIPQESHTVTPQDLGIPDYAHQSPFRISDAAANKFKNQFDLAAESPKPCKVAEMGTADSGASLLFTNICDKTQSDALRALIAEMAPALTYATTTIWKLLDTPNGTAEALVAHTDLSSGEYAHDPYLSIWLINFKDGKVDAEFGGSFLAGEIYAIRPFGHEDNANKVFVKFISCTECEPWVYLTIVDFSRHPAVPVKFTYATDHKDYDETIEYELPGMGHSIDAKVETRIPKGDLGQSVDLMQAFRYTEEKKVEWWVFSCDHGRCDYKVFINALPAKYRASWASGDKL